jgi:putative oxidoreductase
MKIIVLIGRILFSLNFIMAFMSHFSAQGVGYAQMMHVPMAGFLVPFSGVMAVVGGLSVLLGYKAKWGAWLLVIFLIPVTFLMHAFWNVTDQMMMQMQMAIFMKNMAMLGAALLITYFGAGPMSIDAMAQKNS